MVKEKVARYFLDDDILVVEFAEELKEMGVFLEILFKLILVLVLLVNG